MPRLPVLLLSPQNNMTSASNAFHERIEEHEYDSSDDNDSVDQKDDEAMTKMRLGREGNSNPCLSSKKRPVVQRSASDRFLIKSSHIMPTNRLVYPRSTSARFLEAFNHENACLKSIMSVRTNEQSLKQTFPSKRWNRKRGETLSVTFSSIEVQEYPITMGDNPSVSCGPPLTIEWVPASSCTFDISKYEELRKPFRRARADLVLRYSQRWYILSKMGVNPRDILECQQQVKKERDKRRKSLSKISAMTFDIQAKMELTCRGMKNMVMRGRKESQRQLIENGLEIDREAFKKRSAAAAQHDDSKQHEDYSGDCYKDTGEQDYCRTNTEIDESYYNDFAMITAAGLNCSRPPGSSEKDITDNIMYIEAITEEAEGHRIRTLQETSKVHAKSA
mmetsp:Transcript_5528/g.7305  ORF Transcript_5528/g.7305 Transcript_5528/m.7305 type:complete len:391 (+) Transcript_5528:30-1202(+)